MGFFVSWCNENAGFFSLLLSAIAILISIFAIHAQNKGTVFKERLSVYCDALNIFRKSSRIVEICKGKSVEKQKKLIAIIMFEIGSDEQKIIEESCEDQDPAIENSEDSVSNFARLTSQYVDIYIEKYLKDPFVLEVEVFYRPVVFKYIQRLYNLYDNMRLGIIAYDQEEIDKWISELDNLLAEIRRNRILEKMRRKLPV